MFSSLYSELDLLSETFTEKEILDNLDIENNRQQQQEIQENQDQLEPQPNQEQLSVELAKDQQQLSVELSENKDIKPQVNTNESNRLIPNYNHFVLEESHLSEDEVI